MLTGQAVDTYWMNVRVDLPATSSLENMTAAEQDALPYGLIQLGRDGTVLTYNASESRLAQRDPARVIGRNFFTEVAPCTRARIFETQFQSGMQLRKLDCEFDYLFAFKEPRRVLIRMKYSPATDSCWVGVTPL
jgi:chemotaxis family two-component system sensor kinase Cph1